jgi:hypothetical protein
VEQGDREVAQCGDGLGCAVGAGGRGILGEDDVADSVEAVLHLPLHAAHAEQVLRRGVLGFVD